MPRLPFHKWPAPSQHGRSFDHCYHSITAYAALPATGSEAGHKQAGTMVWWYCLNHQRDSLCPLLSTSFLTLKLRRGHSPEAGWVDYPIYLYVWPDIAFDSRLRWEEMTNGNKRWAWSHAKMTNFSADLCRNRLNTLSQSEASSHIKLDTAGNVIWPYLNNIKKFPYIERMSEINWV